MNHYPHFRNEHATLWHADALELLTELPTASTASVDAVITDPPYALDMAGGGWDSAGSFRRALPASSRPGTDARVFQQWCRVWAAEGRRVLRPGGHIFAFGGSRTWHRLVAGIEDAGLEIRDSIAWLYANGMPKSLDVSAALDRCAGEVRPDRATRPAEYSPTLGTIHRVQAKGTPVTAEAQLWQGWGTALRPAFEPLVVARAPLSGTVIGTLSEHGTGALNLAAGSRGGWPPNTAMDPELAQLLIRDVGAASERGARSFPVFRYGQKASPAERPKVAGLTHETVKPLALMRWLVQLATAPGGIVLDPFAGSGTTMEAALAEGRQVIGIERETRYLPLILILIRLHRREDPVAAWAAAGDDLGLFDAFDTPGRLPNARARVPPVRMTEPQAKTREETSRSTD